MKTFLIYLFCSFSVCVFSQLKIDESKFAARRDSVLKNTDFGSVYITKDTSLKYYKWLNPSQFNEEILVEIYNENFEKGFANQKETEYRQIHKNPLLGNWSSLYIFENKLYVYSPSDWIANQTLIVCDSAFYSIQSDYSIQYIQNCKRISETEFECVLIDANEFVCNLNVNFIDTEKNISLWTYKNNDGIRLELKVKSLHVKDYPMIVNDCLDRKCIQEFNFDELDFQKVNDAYLRSL